MIFVTHTKLCAHLKLLSGVLLDDTSEAGLTNDVFRAFLVSNRIQEINCEKPKFHGAHGRTREGKLIVEFETHLFGLTTYAEDPSPNNLYEVAENRVLLATASDPEEMDYPAFLSTEPVSPPTETRVIIRLEARTLGDVPDVRAFVSTERYLLESKEIQAPIATGMILPVTYSSSGRNTMAALKLLTSASPNLYHAAVYHEAGALPPGEGEVLVRNARRVKSNGQKLEFKSVLGTVGT